VKTDASGDTQWTRIYDHDGDNEAYSAQQTTDGGYIIAGWTVGMNFYLVKTDAGGNTLWTRTYGGSMSDWAYSVQQTTDGGYIIAGFTYSFGAGNSDCYLVKTNADGDTLWTRTYGGSFNDEAYSVQQTTDGGYIIAGRTGSFGAGYSDIYLVKTDAGGDTLWTRTYGGWSNDEAHSIQQTTDGGYISAGYTGSFGAGNSDFYLMKTDANGDTLWTRTWGDSEQDEAFSVQQTTDGGYIIAGRTESFGAGSNDIYLVKTDAGGNTLWTRTYGGSNYEYAYSVQQTTDGGYIIAGWTGSFGAGALDFGLVKVKGENPAVIDIVNSPKYPGPDQLCEVSAIITDFYDGWVDYADLHYDTGSGYTSILMSNAADSFYATIPGQPESTLVNYYIIATDNLGSTTASDTFSYFVVEKVASIYMLPMHPPIEVSPGSYFTFIGVLQNDTPVPQAIDVWIMLDVPGIGSYGPISRYNNVPLAPNQVIWSGAVRQNIPSFAPLGDYQYYAICGDYGESGPEVVIDSASFPFTVIPGKISGGATDWKLSGWFDNDNQEKRPIEFSLSNSYPNPFNASTTIEYQMPFDSKVKLEIFNLRGQKVATLVDGNIPAGNHQVSWDASQYSSGIYFYRLVVGEKTFAQRMTLLK